MSAQGKEGGHWPSASSWPVSPAPTPPRGEVPSSLPCARVRGSGRPPTFGIWNGLAFLPWWRSEVGPPVHTHAHTPPKSSRGWDQQDLGEHHTWAARKAFYDCNPCPLSSGRLETFHFLFLANYHLHTLLISSHFDAPVEVWATSLLQLVNELVADPVYNNYYSSNNRGGVGWGVGKFCFLFRFWCSI